MQKGLKQHCPLNVYLFLSISPASFPVLPPMFLFTWTFITLNYGGKSFHEKLRIVKLFCGDQGYRALQIFGCKNKRLFPQVFLHPDSKLSNKQSIETSKMEIFPLKQMYSNHSTIWTLGKYETSHNAFECFCDRLD